MKTIKLLEDTGDDKFVNQLHDFLNDSTYAQGHEWEGGNHGISIYMRVNVGDFVLVNDDKSMRVLRRGEPVGITPHSFPLVHACLLLVELDNGAHHLNRIAEGNPEIGMEKIDLELFTMPFDYGIDKLCTAENALAMFIKRVMKEEFDTFVTGEQSDQETLLKEHLPACPGLDTAHALINDWFNAWETA